MDFWGSGPKAREAGGYSFHLLNANAPEEEVRRHSHDEAHFVLVLAGGYMSSAVGAPLVSDTPVLIYNPPGTTHQDRFHGGRGRFLAISGGTGGDAAALCMREPYAYRLAHSIAQDIDLMTPFRLEARALQLRGFVLPLSSDEPRAAGRPPGWLNRAVEMIFTSDDPDLSVAAVASDAGVHPVHLARVFRRFLGCSPGDYLRGHRMERAAAMLGKGIASLAAVAQSTGYVDQAHLNRTFRSRLDTTPARWRKMRYVAPIQDAEESMRQEPAASL
ncbi:AraC family transcriptional regulator [Polymorphobacter sp. PAMC 29334]|uniref:helix-turn-helix domain-containing protein n=1 Tax=Polymorphobacter sp. PAMC 29334 TaxID=2862331 RepID=UPI001C67D766|nr:AraC family transcriptional regulator [Polymorphobacter sp. PAMC 29334]QYE34706.1 AraC family transcriptional regulator [Polymorphobacter sp. PAMC 29334]